MLEYWLSPTLHYSSSVFDNPPALKLAESRTIAMLVYELSCFSRNAKIFFQPSTACS
jgi:hypothetical protein